MNSANKVIILPMDGYKNGKKLLEGFETIITEPGMSDLVAYVKLNDGIHNQDMGGPTMLRAIKTMQQATGIDFNIFLDLKIFDVSATLINVMKKYLEVAPGILTVSSNCSVDGFIALRRLLPNTKLALIDTLTDISEAECFERFGETPSDKIYRALTKIELLYGAKIASGDNPMPVDLVVCSAKDLPTLKDRLPNTYGFITPGIRDAWMKKADEHQKRVTGVVEALQMGATYVVMGAQLTKGNPEKGISAAESRQFTLEALETYFSEK